MFSLSHFFSHRVSVGLDIADRSIEAAELVKRGGRIQVAALGRQSLPPGVVERGLIKDEAKLAAAIRSVLNLAKPQPIMPELIYFGLPEAQVYLHSFTLADSTSGDQTLESLIAQEARENVPLTADDLLVTYQALGAGPAGRANRQARLRNGQAGTRFLLAAASRQVLGRWQEFFRSLGFQVAFDLETRALFRSLGPVSAVPAAVADFGALTTNVAVFDQLGLRYSRTLTYGADALTESLVKSLKITPAEAEKQKQETGLVDPDSKIFTVLLKGLVPLRDELKVTFDYYERWAGKKVETLYLAGGGSQLRGLADYLKANLEIPTTVAQSVFLNQPLVYLEALGLALKGFAGRREHEEFAFRLRPVGFQSATRDWLKQNLKLITLAAIVLAGGLALVGAWRFRQAVDLARQNAIRARIESLPVVSPEAIFAPGAATSTATSTPEIETITVAETPTGWLNVRSGPGTSFSVATRIYPGENYPLLAEDGEWYKIELGWVNKQYVIKN